MRDFALSVARHAGVREVGVQRTPCRIVRADGRKESERKCEHDVK